jgi:hypothetical protein
VLRQRILRFMSQRDDGSFDSLALEALRFQHHRIPAFRALCASRGVDPESLDDWRAAPPIPTLAFKTLALHAEEPVEVFRSSGTSDQAPSIHYNPYPELYREAVDLAFPCFCLPGLERPPILALVPSRAQAPDSSLAFMVDRVVERFGGSGSAGAFAARGVDVPAARSWIAARQREHRPAVILATSFALAQLLDSLERRYLHFRLAPGSVILHTGGYKGRHRELSPAQLLERVEEYLGVAADQVVREYGMTELSSQCYTAPLLGGDRDLFLPPHWLRPRVLHPETLVEQPPGEEGLLAFLDLANLGSAAYVLTEDLGVAEGEGFRLVGRASEAELRGCSLTVEELSASGGEPSAG